MPARTMRPCATPQVGTPQKHPRWHRAGTLAAQWASAAVAGVSALGLLRVLAPFFGFTVKINAASLAIAALLGTPGVVLLLVLRLFFWVG